MKKQLFTVCLTLATAFSFAQTPRLTLFEEFTGETCPPCASTNPGLNAILLAPTNTALCVSLKWQVPIPSAPSNTWSLYKTNKAEIDWRYKSSLSGGYGYPSQTNSAGAITNGVNSAPSGRFDGQHQWSFGATSDHPAYVSNAVIATAQSYTSAFSVVLAKEWDQTMSSINVTVNVRATAPFTSSGALIFRTVMIESLIQFSVQPGTNGEKKFENVAIKSFPTLQNGVALPGTWVLDQSKTFTLNCPLPSYVRDVNEVDFVGFIQDDGNKKVAQSVRGSDCAFVSASIGESTVVCQGQPVTVTAAGGASGIYTWSNGQTGSSIVITPTSDGTIYVTSNDPAACPNRGEVAYSVDACTGIKNIAGNTLQVDIYPNPSKGEFIVKSNFSNEKTQMVIFNSLGQKVYEQSLNANDTAVKTNLSKGLYSYEIIQNSKKMNTGKLVIE